MRQHSGSGDPEKKGEAPGPNSPGLPHMPRALQFGHCGLGTTTVSNNPDVPCSELGTGTSPFPSTVCC